MTVRAGRAIAKRAVTALLPGYAYDPRTHNFRQLGVPGFVKRKVILAKLETQINDRERELASLVERFTSADLNGLVYARTADILLKRQALQQAALSAGGWDRLTASDYGRVGQMLGVQYRSNAKLVADYYAGTVSPAQAMQRIHMAMGNVRMVGMQIDLAHRPAAAVGTVRIEIRHLDAQAIHCDKCQEYFERGWCLEGELPRPGDDSQCDGSCRCDIMSREVPVADLDNWLGTRH